MKEGTIIKELESINHSQLEDIKRLMSVLSPSRTLDEETLRETLRSSRLYVIEQDEQIIGMATLCPFVSPTGRKASVEDVVIDPQHQGQGLGRMLVEHLLKEASSLAPISIQLTSRPSRIAANALYRKLGFTQKETNFYVLRID